MNPYQLYGQCMNQINRMGDGACLMLVVPRNPSGERIRLTKEGGPLGLVMSAKQGETVAAFKCASVIKWLNARMLPHECFICEKNTAVIPWAVNLENRGPSAVFTCKKCPHLHDHLKSEYDATITSTAEAVNRNTVHLYETQEKSNGT